MACPGQSVGIPGETSSSTLLTTGELTITSHWQAINDLRLSQPRDEINRQFTWKFSNGIGANQIKEVFFDRRTATLASPTDDIDLSGVLTNAFNQTILFTTIRELIIINRAERSGENILVGGAGIAANAWSSPFGGDQHAVWLIKAGGMKVLIDPLVGYEVVAAESDTLRIQHDGVTGDIDYDIVIKGTV